MTHRPSRLPRQRWALGLGAVLALVAVAGGLAWWRRPPLAPRLSGPAPQGVSEGWRREQRQRALERFAAGDLAGSLALLRPLGQDHRGDGRALGDELRAIWERNRQNLERADRLIGQSRWWEALDALNRLDHPWWKSRSADRRRRVDGAIARLREADHHHDSHGALPHTVPDDQLDALVQRRMAAGRSDWQAFEESCRELGGRVVEAGPESACQR